MPSFCSVRILKVFVFFALCVSLLIPAASVQAKGHFDLGSIAVGANSQSDLANFRHTDAGHTPSNALEWTDNSFGGVNHVDSTSSQGGSEYQGPASEVTQYAEQTTKRGTNSKAENLDGSFGPYGGVNKQNNTNSVSTLFGSSNVAWKAESHATGGGGAVGTGVSGGGCNGGGCCGGCGSSCLTADAAHPSSCTGACGGVCGGSCMGLCCSTSNNGGGSVGSISGSAANSNTGPSPCPGKSEGHPAPGFTFNSNAVDNALVNRLRDSTLGFRKQGDLETKMNTVVSTAMGITANAIEGVKKSNTPGQNAAQAKENQNTGKNQAADNLAAVERYHAAAAIDFVRGFVENFTVDAGNKWNTVRNMLFIPMAILILLPGAILTQVKSIVAAGSPSIVEPVAPFEGLQRAIIAIFLIPATYLVVNYGIDVANSLTYTIADTYHTVFGTDMYEDAFCGHIRAFPIREPQENYGIIKDVQSKMYNYFGNTPLARLEGKTLAVKYDDPCAGLYIVPEDRANDVVPYYVNEERLAFNQANAALTVAWTILCAVQECFLYYLWFVGPVVAALWVYPSQQLRAAFSGWVEGVVSVCMWSLFWSTGILLMAICRGVDDTGTIMFSALNFLVIGSVKAAFDFTSLVKDAGQQAVQLGQQVAAAAAQPQGGGAGGGGGGAASGASHGQGQGQGQGRTGGQGTAGLAGIGARPGAAAGAAFAGANNGSPNSGDTFASNNSGTGQNVGALAANQTRSVNGQVSVPDVKNPPLTNTTGFIQTSNPASGSSFLQNLKAADMLKQLDAPLNNGCPPCPPANGGEDTSDNPPNGSSTNLPTSALHLLGGAGSTLLGGGSGLNLGNLGSGQTASNPWVGGAMNHYQSTALHAVSNAHPGEATKSADAQSMLQTHQAAVQAALMHMQQQAKEAGVEKMNEAQRQQFQQSQQQAMDKLLADQNNQFNNQFFAGGQAPQDVADDQAKVQQEADAAVAQQISAQASQAAASQAFDKGAAPLTINDIDNFTHNMLAAGGPPQTGNPSGAGNGAACGPAEPASRSNTANSADQLKREHLQGMAQEIGQRTVPNVSEANRSVVPNIHAAFDAATRNAGGTTPANACPVPENFNLPAGLPKASASQPEAENSCKVVGDTIAGVHNNWKEAVCKVGEDNAVQGVRNATDGVNGQAGSTLQGALTGTGSAVTAQHKEAANTQATSAMESGNNASPLPKPINELKRDALEQIGKDIGNNSVPPVLDANRCVAPTANGAPLTHSAQAAEAGAQITPATATAPVVHLEDNDTTVNSTVSPTQAAPTQQKEAAGNNADTRIVGDTITGIHGQWKEAVCQTGESAARDSVRNATDGVNGAANTTLHAALTGSAGGSVAHADAAANANAAPPAHVERHLQSAGSTAANATPVQSGSAPNNACPVPTNELKRDALQNIGQEIGRNSVPEVLSANRNMAAASGSASVGTGSATSTSGSSVVDSSTQGAERGLPVRTPDTTTSPVVHNQDNDTTINNSVAPAQSAPSVHKEAASASGAANADSRIVGDAITGIHGQWKEAVCQTGEAAARDSVRNAADGVNGAANTTLHAALTGGTSAPVAHAKAAAGETPAAPVERHLQSGTPNTSGATHIASGSTSSATGSSFFNDTTPNSQAPVNELKRDALQNIGQEIGRNSVPEVLSANRNMAAASGSASAASGSISSTSGSSVVESSTQGAERGLPVRTPDTSTSPVVHNQDNDTTINNSVAPAQSAPSVHKEAASASGSANADSRIVGDAITGIHGQWKEAVCQTGEAAARDSVRNAADGVNGAANTTLHAALTGGASAPVAHAKAAAGETPAAPVERHVQSGAPNTSGATHMANGSTSSATSSSFSNGTTPNSQAPVNELKRDALQHIGQEIGRNSVPEVLSANRNMAAATGTASAASGSITSTSGSSVVDSSTQGAERGLPVRTPDTTTSPVVHNQDNDTTINNSVAAAQPAPSVHKEAASASGSANADSRIVGDAITGIHGQWKEAVCQTGEAAARDSVRNATDGVTGMANTTLHSAITGNASTPATTGSASAPSLTGNASAASVSQAQQNVERNTQASPAAPAPSNNSILNSLMPKPMNELKREALQSVGQEIGNKSVPEVQSANRTVAPTTGSSTVEQSAPVAERALPVRTPDTTATPVLNKQSTDVSVNSALTSTTQTNALPNEASNTTDATNGMQVVNDTITGIHGQWKEAVCQTGEAAARDSVRNAADGVKGMANTTLQSAITGSASAPSTTGNATAPSVSQSQQNVERNTQAASSAPAPSHNSILNSLMPKPMNELKREALQNVGQEIGNKSIPEVQAANRTVAPTTGSATGEQSAQGAERGLPVRTPDTTTTPVLNKPGTDISVNNVMATSTQANAMPKEASSTTDATNSMQVVNDTITGIHGQWKEAVCQTGEAAARDSVRNAQDGINTVAGANLQSTVTGQPAATTQATTQSLEINAVTTNTTHSVTANSVSSNIQNAETNNTVKQEQLQKLGHEIGTNSVPNVVDATRHAAAAGTPTQLLGQMRDAAEKANVPAAFESAAVKDANAAQPMTQKGNPNTQNGGVQSALGRALSGALPGRDKQPEAKLNATSPMAPTAKNKTPDFFNDHKHEASAVNKAISNQLKKEEEQFLQSAEEQGRKAVRNASELAANTPAQKKAKRSAEESKASEEAFQQLMDKLSQLADDKGKDK